MVSQKPTTYLKMIENLRFFHILLILVEYPKIGKLKSQNVIAYETPFISKAERGKRWVSHLRIESCCIDRINFHSLLWVDDDARQGYIAAPFGPRVIGVQRALFFWFMRAFVWVEYFQFNVGVPVVGKWLPFNTYFKHLDELFRNHAPLDQQSRPS